MKAVTLSVLCWCQKRTVAATQQDIPSGRTRSCGAAGCKAPDGSRRRSVGGKVAKPSRALPKGKQAQNGHWVTRRVN